MDAATARAIVDPKVYADERAFHELFTRLRKEEPVGWVETPTHRPFWAITKLQDIQEIEKASDIFLAEPRAMLAPAAVEAERKERMVRTLVDMDDPDHRTHRAMTQAWFMPANLRKLEADITEIAKAYVGRMAEMGGECDFAKDVAVWYPLRVIMKILGVPPEDEPLMLRLTQESFGSEDPELRRTSGDPDATLRDLVAYFTEVLEDRRRNPRDDVATVIANAQIDGKPLGLLQALGYCVIIAVAGHDTTSSATAGGLLALLQHPHELKRLRENPDLLPGAMDEIIRWVSPVKNFMRTANRDYQLRDRTIRAGDSVLLCYWSANRDEDVFEDPFTFRIDRSPNRHVGFGYGPHVCLGQHLAKLEMRLLFKELLTRIDSIELTGTPALSEATFVSGLKRMPIKYKVVGG